MKTIYNKLIRDHIPEIIESDGKVARFEKIEGERLLRELNLKLEEELAEYKGSGAVEELADIYEVIKGILDYKGISELEFKEIVEKKATKRGSFKKGLFLIEVEG